MRSLNIERIEKAFDWLAKEYAGTGEIQSIDLLVVKLDMLSSTIAWSSEQMAIAKVFYKKAKVAAYHRLELSTKAQNKHFSPSLAKDYVDALCTNEEYCYDLAERLTRTCTHISENLRTSISALKETLKMELYAQNVPR
jgi:hypothetical protein